MDKKYYIDIFTSLGKRLESFGDFATQYVIAQAMEANAWFTEKDIIFAVESIRRGMLHQDILEKWLAGFDLPDNAPKRIALIMAGNIPLVGFSDLICVLATGNAAYVKTSSKDTALMRYIISQIKDIDACIPIFDYSTDRVYDAVIATGSNDTGKYFRSAFDGLPAIIRGSRSSVAIITGNESAEELHGLKDDIFTYSGLGCRNVSLIFVPDNYDLEQLGQILAPRRTDVNKKYFNNYLSLKAGFFASGIEFIDCGTFVITEGKAFPVSLSNLVALRYSNLDEVSEWLGMNDNSVQCVISNRIKHQRVIAFGQAQFPYIWDYPDGENVVRFLNDLM